MNSGGWVLGAARGIRTPDPIITNDVLYQLSYCGPRRATPSWRCSNGAAVYASSPRFGNTPKCARKGAVRLGTRRDVA
jgi:hypothetical protein